MSTSGEGGGWEGGGSREGQPGEDPAQRRSRKRTKSGIYTSDVTVEDLARHFHQPASKACQELGMGLTIFKRVCRKLGLQRWPYEKPTRGDSGSGGQQCAPAAPHPQLRLLPSGAAPIPLTGALSTSQPWLMQGAGYQQPPAVGQQQQQAQPALYWDSAAPAGLGGWAPPSQPLSPGPSRSSRGLPATIATRPGPGAQMADLMAATLQLETALQQGGSSGLKSAAIQRLAEVLVQDSAAAQELLAAIGQAIQRQQQAAKQPADGSPAASALPQPLPVAMPRPQQQVQPSYSAAQPGAPQLPLPQQQGLPPARLQQQPQQQVERDQLAAVLRALRWAVQNDEQPLPPPSPPQPEPRPAEEEASGFPPLLLHLLNWQQQQQLQQGSQQEPLQREQQQEQQQQQEQAKLEGNGAMLPEHVAQRDQEQQQQEAQQPQSGAHATGAGTGAQPAALPPSASTAADQQLQLSSRPAELARASPGPAAAGGAEDVAAGARDAPPAPPAGRPAPGAAHGGSPVHQPQPLLQLPQGPAGLQPQGDDGQAGPAGASQQLQALAGALATGTLPPAALALLAAALQSGAATPAAPAAGGAAGAEQGSAAGEEAAAGGDGRGKQGN